jgi:isopenicillin N synthase-like dioxygenase
MSGSSAPTLRARNASRVLALAEAAAEAKPFDTIPIIDISPLFDDDPANHHDVGAEIRKACMEVGFFYISGHGVDPAIYADAFEAAERFFNLPEDQKQAVSIHNSPVMRGYTGLLQENTAPDNDGDLHEGFDASLDLEPDDPDVALGIYGYGVNQWPEIQNFREPIMAYHAALRSLSEALYRGFALSLDLPEDHFAPMLTKPIAELRLLHYPPRYRRPLRL